MNRLNDERLQPSLTARDPTRIAHAASCAACARVSATAALMTSIATR